MLEMHNADQPTLQLPAEKIPQLIGEWFIPRMLAVAHALASAARKITAEKCPVSRLRLRFPYQLLSLLLLPVL